MRCTSITSCNILVISTLFAMLAVNVHGDVYVSVTGSGDCSGRDADNACAGIAAGYAAASAGDTIRLLGGSVYDVTAPLAISKDNLTFEGLVANPNQVVLDAGGRSTAFFSASKPVKFRGMTFRNNNATAASALVVAAGCSSMDVSCCNFSGCTNTTMGGAVSCGMITARVVISNCVFASCTSSSNYGGALARSNGSLFVYDSEFTNCYSGATSRGGGAVYDANIVAGCTFVDNKAASDGGGCHLRDAKGVVSNCTFIACSAGSGAAVVACDLEGTVVDCVFSNNVATASKVTGCVGGTKVAVINCDFFYNATPKGGAIFNVPTIVDTDFIGNCGTVEAGALYYTSALTTPCIISNCTFVGNRSAAAGGVQSAMPNAAESFVDCVFAENEAATFGGVYYRQSGTEASFLRCDFSCNAAVKDGGALYGPKTVEKCVFSNNVCGAKGAAVYFNIAGAAATDCIFMKNLTATNGTETLGAGCVHAIATTLLRQCLFVGNESRSSAGGGAVSWNNVPTTMTLESCTIAFNGGVTSMRGQNANTGCTATNCLFYGNRDAGEVLANFASTMPMSGIYNNVPFGLGVCAVDVANVNFSADNGFVLASSPFVSDGIGAGLLHTSGDCHLSRKSGAVKNPCIDVAARLPWMTVQATDLDGSFGAKRRLRVVGSGPDIGCYEYLMRYGSVLIYR